VEYLRKINSGDFNCFLKYQKTQASFNDFNEKTITYSDLSFGTGNSITRIPAIRNINSLRNINEKVEGEMKQAYGNFFILVRYFTALNNALSPDARLIDINTDVTYDILSYIVDDRKHFIEFYTKQRIN